MGTGEQGMGSGAGTVRTRKEDQGWIQEARGSGADTEVQGEGSVAGTRDGTKRD